MLVSYLKRWKRMPILLHVHGGHMLMKPPKKGSAFDYMIRYMLKKSKINIVLSSIEQQKLRDNFGADAAILPNTVPPPPLPFRKRTFNKKIKFIFLGRLVREKGIYLLVDAFRALGSGYDKFNFTIYGAGPEKDQWLSHLQTINGLEFTYAGITKGADKWKALDDADVFLLPSLFGEGMPIAMLEAMQSGCVPVVSDDASIGTVVKDGSNGLIVAKGDTAKLIETINRIISNQLDLPSLSQKAMETIENEYNISGYVRKLAGYYSFLSD
jgi:glycosyltransferase involved in cell wall biosynthesis